MKKRLLNFFAKRGYTNKFKCAFLSLGLFLFIENSFGQTGGAVGFEDNGTLGFIGGGSTETLSNSALAARTGSKSLEFITTSTSSNKYWYTNSLFGTSSSGNYVHFIYWAKATTGQTPTVDASMRYGSTNPPSGTGSSANSSTTATLNDAIWTKVSYNAGNSNGRYYFPAPRRTNGAIATIYVDDVVMYVSNSSTTDLTDPSSATLLSGNATGSNVTINWTSATDAGTGVQNTIVLRTSNVSATAPELNDQALYSTTGGSAGPNTIGDWTIISTTTGAAVETYNDNALSDGNYKYAIVLRDAAYNYSTAVMSSTITVEGVLPITLNSFKTNLNTNGISLNWVTSSEINADKFVVERRINSSFFENIAEVEAKRKASNYAINDANVVIGQTYYYRLKMVDKDGSSEISEVVSAKFGLSTNTTLSIYPNPASNTITINFNENSFNASKLLIVDSKGAVVLKVDVPANASQQTVDISYLKTGMYFIHGNINGKKISSKLIKN